MKETDWDAPDDDSVIDFEDISFEKEPQKEVVVPLKKEAVIKPAPPKKEYSPPPSPPKKEEAKEESGISENQEKSINNAAKAAQKLSKELETLDFQIEKFIKFEQKVSSFKIKNTVTIGAVALLLGGYIGSYSQKELNDYYVNQEVKNKVGESLKNTELIQKLNNYGVVFGIDSEQIVIYSNASNKAVSTFQNDKHQGLQLTFHTKTGDKK